MSTALESILALDEQIVRPGSIRTSALLARRRLPMRLKKAKRVKKATARTTPTRIKVKPV